MIYIKAADDCGQLSLGGLGLVLSSQKQAAVDCAHHIIALVNPRMPRTHGDGFIHVSDIDIEAGVINNRRKKLNPGRSVWALRRPNG